MGFMPAIYRCKQEREQRKEGEDLDQRVYMQGSMFIDYRKLQLQFIFVVNFQLNLMPCKRQISKTHQVPASTQLYCKKCQNQAKMIISVKYCKGFVQIEAAVIKHLSSHISVLCCPCYITSSGYTASIICHFLMHFKYPCIQPMQVTYKEAHTTISAVIGDVQSIVWSRIQHNVCKCYTNILQMAFLLDTY